jgi:type I restriction enzyme M protein
MTQEAPCNDYNLGPNCYVTTNVEAEVLPLEGAMILLREAEGELSEAERALSAVLSQLRLDRKRERWTCLIRTLAQK